MKHLSLSTIMLAAFACASAQTKQLFNNDWQFTLEGKTMNVDLPHDWAISYAPDPATGASGTDGGWYPGGKVSIARGLPLPRAKW